MDNPELDKIIQLIPKYNPVKTAEDCYFDYDSARKAIEAVESLCTHVKGIFAGKPFLLEDWQKSIIANLFGWKRLDDSRRYRECFLYVPRKNGKTILAAAIVVLMLFTDNEPAAEIIGAAASREQSALLFDVVKMMIRNEPELSNRCKIYQKAISIENTGSFYKSISSDANTAHGLNIHCAVVDEFHAQPNRELVDVIRTSTASTARRQPLIMYTTTADFDRPSICNETLDYAEKIRDGVIKNNAFLPIIYQASQRANWRSPATWKKANPNYGISVDAEYLKRECKKAQDIPAYENTFKRLHLNIVTEQADRWLSLDDWDKCGDKLPDLKGQVCYGGLDLASTTDTSAFILYFPESHSLIANVWIPSENVEQREKRDRVPYATWQRDGFITLTHGNVIDYEVIRERINQLAKEYDIREVAIDPWNATHLLTQLLSDGINAVSYTQNLKGLSAPSKHLETLIRSGKLNHGGNPVLRWQASNVSVVVDSAENIKPVKGRSNGRIDAIMASIMAVGRAIAQPVKQEYSCPLVIV